MDEATKRPGHARLRPHLDTDTRFPTTGILHYPTQHCLVARIGGDRPGQKSAEVGDYDNKFVWAWAGLNSNVVRRFPTRKPTYLSGFMEPTRPDPPQADAPIPANRWVIFLSLAIAGAIADLWSKQAIFAWRGLPGQRDVWWLVEHHFGIETAVNTGAVFGVGAGQGTVFAALSVIAGIGIMLWLFRFGAARSIWLTIALGMISGGILGNLYDRLGLWWRDEPAYLPAWKSGVRDWILVRFEGVPLFDPWPNFNIADSLLVVGAGMLILQTLLIGESSEKADQGDAEETDQPVPSETTT